MKKVLIFAGVAEAATGLALLIVPSLVGRLLLGEELTGIAVPVARVTGIDLLGLGVACWPGPPPRDLINLPRTSLAGWRAAKAPVMSAYGTKRTLVRTPSMSALGGKADIPDPRSRVRY